LYVLLLKLVPVVLSAAPLVAAAFPWGEMDDQALWGHVLWTPFLSGYRLKDVVLNVLVTLPVGLAAAAVIRRHPLLTAVAIATVVSVLCEWAQVYAPDRYPSGTDVVCNALGAATGVALLEAGWPDWTARG
jgi:glycopeptide antibiotics resistance protein